MVLVVGAEINVAGETRLNKSHENADKRKCNSTPLIVVHGAVMVAPLNFMLQIGEYDQILNEKDERCAFVYNPRDAYR